MAIGLEHFWGILAVIRNSLCDRETLHLSFAWLFMLKQWIPSHKTTVLKRPWQDVERNKQTSFEYTYLETSLMFKYLIIINFHVMYLYTPINLNQNPNYYTLSNLNLSQYIGMINYKQMLIKFKGSCVLTFEVSASVFFVQLLLNCCVEIRETL